MIPRVRSGKLVNQALLHLHEAAAIGERSSRLIGANSQAGVLQRSSHAAPQKMCITLCLSATYCFSMEHQAQMDVKMH